MRRAEEDWTPACGEWGRTTADGGVVAAVNDGERSLRTLWTNTDVAERMVVVGVEGGFERLGECYGREKRR